MAEKSRLTERKDIEVKYCYYYYNYYIIIIYNEIARSSASCWVAELDFQHLAGPKNVSVDLKL